MSDNMLPVLTARSTVSSPFLIVLSSVLTKLFLSLSMVCGFFIAVTFYVSICTFSFTPSLSPSLLGVQ